MTLVVKEILARTILSRSKIYPYVVNPYTGCQHGCSYCYARFMKRVTGHKEPWGEFVDVKINAAELLLGENKEEEAEQSLDKRGVRPVPTARGALPTYQAMPGNSFSK